jgi:hypothetical protein
LLRQPDFAGREEMYDLLTPISLGVAGPGEVVTLETLETVALSDGCRRRVSEGWPIYLADARKKELPTRCRTSAVLQLGDLDDWAPMVGVELATLASDESDVEVRNAIHEVLEARGVMPTRLGYAATTVRRRRI